MWILKKRPVIYKIGGINGSDRESEFVYLTLVLHVTTKHVLSTNKVGSNGRTNFPKNKELRIFVKKNVHI